MDNKNNTPNPQDSLEYWENELRYFETSLEALKQCFGLLSSLKAHAQEKYNALVPEREEVT